MGSSSPSALSILCLVDAQGRTSTIYIKEILNRPSPLQQSQIDHRPSSNQVSQDSWKYELDERITSSNSEDPHDISIEGASAEIEECRRKAKGMHLWRYRKYRLRRSLSHGFVSLDKLQ